MLRLLVGHSMNSLGACWELSLQSVGADIDFCDYSGFRLVKGQWAQGLDYPIHASVRDAHI
jgi:hypothetical protein